MKKLIVIIGISFLSLAICVSNSQAQMMGGPVYLYVDSAPNAYGSPDWSTWQANAYATAANGTFVNMQNSVNPSFAGTQNFDIRDVTVYSFGDLGRRLHFVYWVPNTTIQNLQGNFDVALYFDWDGVTYDGYDYYYGQTWLEPTTWEEYNGGVIGTAGWAWWGAYGYTSPSPEAYAALQNDLDAWDPLQGNITFKVRYNGEITSLTAYHPPIPEPATLSLFGLSFLGLLGIRRKK